MNEPIEIPPVRTPVEEPSEAPIVASPTARRAGEAVSSTMVYHGTLLATSLTVIILSLFMSVRGEEDVALPFFERPLPGICTFKRMTGMGCPGCGLTRCFISLGHGDIRAAAHFNLVGIFFYLLVAFQIPYRALQIWRVRQGQPEFSPGWWGGMAVGSIAFALLGQWIIRMVLRLF
ncbi:MAG: DUF2752 domain-containing protein [Pirellulaceae bacterium]|nr:DUF2752 domain-containing protein [Pirellulaceae bacterium]